LKDDDHDWPSPANIGWRGHRDDGPEGHRHEGPHGPPDAPPSFAGDNWKENEEYRQQAVTILERLVAKPRSMPDYRQLLARCYREIAASTFGWGGKSRADNLDKATRILEALWRENPDVADYRYDLSETYAMRSDRGPWGWQTPGRDDDKHSADMLNKALTLSEQLVAENPNIPEYAMSLVLIRLRLNHQLQQSDRAGAEANLRKALDTQTNLVKRFPNNSSYNFWKTVIQESLCDFYWANNRLTEARSALQDCIRLREAALPTDPRPELLRGIVAWNYDKLSGLLRSMGENQQAEEARRHARQIMTPDARPADRSPAPAASHSD
jgi:tetratricopeptide (TPR) repeat protein